VRVVSDEGEQLGIMPLKQALMRAEEMGLDLVEISPNAVPPVCKIVNFGKLKYQQTKKEKENKKTQHQVKIKEIKIKPGINQHDFETKANHARDFILKGNKVRMTLVFRGREMLHMDLGMKLIDKMLQILSDIATIEAPLKSMGKIITVVLAPLGKKPKSTSKGEEKSAKNENQQVHPIEG
jgi:translation initiation factor IF-3